MTAVTVFAKTVGKSSRPTSGRQSSDATNGQEANPLAMAETPITSAKPPISLPCAQSMTASGKRSDCSRTSRKTLPTRPDSRPPQTPRALGLAACPVLARGLDCRLVPGLLPWRCIFGESSVFFVKLESCEPFSNHIAWQDKESGR